MRHPAITKGLAAAGTVLVSLPLAATVLTAVPASLRSGALRVDYLMPAELAPAALLGGILLVWAALRARSHRALLGGALATAFVMLVGSQALAVATGLASGETKPAGWPLYLVVGGIAAYAAAVLVMAVGGAMLVGALTRSRIGQSGG